MLTSLHVEGFRCFRSLTIQRLARVNLIVGLNNAGKTTVLDAVELLLGRGEWSHFRDQSSRRGELLHIKTFPEAEVRHLFHGHGTDTGASFLIKGRVGEAAECVEAQLSAVGDDGDREERRALTVTSSKGRNRRRLSPLGGLAWPQASPAIQVPRQWPLLFLGTASTSGPLLGLLWDRVVLSPEEAHVVEALRVVEPSVERIAYTRQEGTRRDAFFVKLAGSDGRVPLGSMGDGIKRLLLLALHLAQSGGGALLIDEIDTGLHYSVMVRMWRLVIETARRLDVQVFATTHSLDCILAITELCERSPELAGDVLLHRIDRDAPEAVTYSADALRTAAQQQMEVRGHGAEAE